MGTPDESVWPGVTELPDYKSFFPQWPKKPTDKICENLDANGRDLLEVSAKLTLSINAFENFFSLTLNA